ncbi:uncharacterized protein LOC116474997 isoform X4 [Hylobates moloch]|uniref:uncharacterized protein LOC116474997 isoform X4 n=1 Tax=Hylobates moloch TaxID=81572 RepID=UPI002675C928|nr:uncharacterized protein LOC116474997 isoform X4 [Hylobates moloch]
MIIFAIDGEVQRACWCSKARVGFMEALAVRLTGTFHGTSTTTFPTLRHWSRAWHGKPSLGGCCGHTSAGRTAGVEDYSVF